MAKYKLQYTSEYKEDIAEFKKIGNKIALKKIDALLKELAEHPKIGTGKPEQLKRRENCWSRRITKKHRLVYEIKEDVVIVLVLAAFGHYDD